MCKKIVAFFLSIVMIFTMLPSMVVTVEAATKPLSVTEAQAVAQLNALIDAFVTNEVNYFSETEGVPCTTSSHAGCSKCGVSNVVNEPWFKKKVERVPSLDDFFIRHWFNDWKLTNGQACMGFANFAGWYIFSQKRTDKVTFNPLQIDGKDVYELSYEVLKKAQPGDILRFGDDYIGDDGDHSAIFISCNKNYIKVLDCNSDNYNDAVDDRRPSGGCNSEIRVHHYGYGYRDFVTISRAENYAPTISATNVASTGKPKITWTNVPGAAKYEVYRAESSNGTYTKISTPTGTTVTNTKAVVGKTYWYKVRAIYSDGVTGAFSAVVKRTCDLPMVTNVTCSNVTSTGGIKISWDAVEGADYYGLYRSTAADGTYSRWDGELTKLSYTNVNKTVPGTTYYYKVRAFVNDNAEATSAYSQYASATRKCAQPVLEVDTPNDAETGKPRLSWTAVDGAQKYRVGRADSANGTYNFLEYAEGTTWIDTSAVPGETYYYKVRAAAENSAGNSAMSAYVKRTCSLPKRPSVTANGTITSYLDASANVTVEMFANGSTEADYTTTVKGNSATYSIESVAAGTYTMKVSKLNHVTREYTVVVTDTAVTQDAKIHPKGDVTGDGRVNTSDVAKANAHAKKTTLLTDYALACADITGDGRVNTSDVAKANAHAKKTNLLW